MLIEQKKKDHNMLWHYRNSHNAKLRVVAVFKQPQHVVAHEDMPWCESRVVAVKWNDHEFGLMKIPQGVVVITFYSHDAMWDKFQTAEGLVSVSSASDRAASWCFLQPCLLIVWRRFLMTKWRSWMMQALTGACFLVKSVTITFYGKLKKLRFAKE